MMILGTETRLPIPSSERQIQGNLASKLVGGPARREPTWQPSNHRRTRFRHSMLPRKAVCSAPGARKTWIGYACTASCAETLSRLSLTRRRTDQWLLVGCGMEIAQPKAHKVKSTQASKTRAPKAKVKTPKGCQNDNKTSALLLRL